MISWIGYLEILNNRTPFQLPEPGDYASIVENVVYRCCCTVRKIQTVYIFAFFVINLSWKLFLSKKAVWIVKHNLEKSETILVYIIEICINFSRVKLYFEFLDLISSLKITCSRSSQQLQEMAEMAVRGSRIIFLGAVVITLVTVRGC